MAVAVVFDADVMIGFLNRSDANHGAAVERVRASLGDERRAICAVNYSEVLIGPLRAGTDDAVETMRVRFGIEVVPVDAGLARGAAAVRARTGLKLPDAFALATAMQLERSGLEAVRLETFDRSVLRAYGRLGRDGAEPAG